MEIKRDVYLRKLIDRQHNGLVKVITGIRRCGKSYLLFELFYKYLQEQGVEDNHIIKLALDDRKNKKYRNPDDLCDYVHAQIVDDKPYYILLDEVQFVDEFEDVLNSFLHIKNADTYVTGSNAKFLSKDIITEFRGRGDEIHVSPLSFKEFYSVYDGSKEDAWKEYCLYGGLPKILEYKTDEDKVAYLKNIFEETYLTDIKERHKIRNDAELAELLDILSSSIGSLTNPKKLSDTFKSVKQVSIHPDTLNNYLEHLVDSYLISQAKRYDIKGKKYINTPSKYYFTDIGLRNARLNFRQNEETHIMENVIYNELKIMGFNLDVGVVEYSKAVDGKSVRVQAEVDFVCNKADKRYYIQSAFSIPDREKMLQEQNSLTRINDSFKKIIIVKDSIKTHYNEDGILILNLFDFLLKGEFSMENNLWGDIFDSSQNAEPVLKIIEEQAILLSHRTSGKVTAVFEKIKYINKYPGLQTMISTVLQVSGGVKKELEDNQQLEDAHFLYDTCEYKFEIVSETLKYRIFNLIYNPVFPLKIKVEPGVLSNDLQVVEINNVDEAQTILAKILKSSKVRFIIQEMIKNKLQ